jgi:hypothetical protein
MGFNLPEGPVIKPLRKPGNDKFPDKGLYKNAEEFHTNLETLIRATLGA